MKKKGVIKNMNGSSSAVYGIGFIGALVYFIQHASNFGEGILGFLKALVWPAFAVYKLLEFLKL
jgi:hypothetical protein